MYNYAKSRYRRKAWKNIKLSAVIASLLWLLTTATGNAQTVNGVPIKEIDVQYIQIVGTSKLLTTNVTINIDFGQENRVFNRRDTQIKGADGKLLSFNSMIDALNFMSANGYDFVQAYTVTSGGQNVYHYLMRKRL